MIPSIVALIVFIIFVIYLIVIFYPPFILLLVNGVILWIIGTRGYVEIVSEGRDKYYAFGALIAAIFIVFYGFGTWHSVWWVTVFCIVVFVVAQNYMFFEEKGIEKKVKNFFK